MFFNFTLNIHHLSCYFVKKSEVDTVHEMCLPVKKKVSILIVTKYNFETCSRQISTFFPSVFFFASGGKENLHHLETTLDFVLLSYKISSKSNVKGNSRSRDSRFDGSVKEKGINM